MHILQGLRIQKSYLIIIH